MKYFGGCDVGSTYTKAVILDENGNVAIAVVKKVENPASEVDCVTGATLTSNGVSDMLRDGLVKGVKLLQASANDIKAEEE
jgi:Na+-transporting NADH:ubiquinone oxidoreductase subunit NqrC